MGAYARVVGEVDEAAGPRIARRARLPRGARRQLSREADRQNVLEREGVVDKGAARGPGPRRIARRKDAHVVVRERLLRVPAEIAERFVGDGVAETVERAERRGAVWLRRKRLRVEARLQENRVDAVDVRPRALEDAYGVGL